LEENSTGSVGCRSVPLGDLTYTVLDIETTGLKPQGNGITEICCLRVVGGEIVARFSTLVNPGMPIPHFIQNMTGITDAMVRDAPPFGGIIPDLLQFLGDTVLVAHNAPFDLSFLNYGLYSHGGRHLHNTVLDSCRLSRKLIPGLRSASLDSLIRQLEIEVRDRHRAEGDAEATVALLLHLLGLCREQGIETDTQLMAFAAPARTKQPPKAAPRPSSRADKLAVLAERCRTLPDAPGIYIMRGVSGRILYVGKAISLRRRVASYFSDDLHGKTRRLMGEVDSIEHRQVGSELEALMEESRMIKLHQPRFNVMLRDYQDFPFLKVDDSGRYPKLQVTREIHEDGARYYGPLHNMKDTEMALGILSRCFRLYDDRCPGRAGKNCLYLQMDRCLGPCLGPERRQAHRLAVDELCRRIEADPEGLVEELVRLRDAAAERLDFETAALYRDGINALSNGLMRQQILAPPLEGVNVLAVSPSAHQGWAELFVFEQGRMTGRARVFAADGAVARQSLVELMESVARMESGGTPRSELLTDLERLDQVNIITSWLEGQGPSASTVVLEPGWASERFTQVVDRVWAAARLAAGVEVQR
jgi:DNA polymerase III subunit epsilon